MNLKPKHRLQLVLAALYAGSAVWAAPIPAMPLPRLPTVGDPVNGGYQTLTGANAGTHSMQYQSMELKALKHDPLTTGTFSGNDQKGVQNAANVNSANGTRTIVIDHSSLGNVDHANNTGITVGGEVYDIGSSKVAAGFNTLNFRRNEPVGSPLWKRIKYIDYSMLLAPRPRPAPRPASKPATKVNKKVYDASTHNKASMNNNQGVVSNSGNVIQKQDTCTIYIERRDFSDGVLLPRARRKGGHHKGGGASTCACQCSKRSVADDLPVMMAARGAVAVQVLLERSCSILRDNQTNEYSWRGDCDKSTVDGRPVTEMFAEAET